jgi:polyphosphate kinase
MIDEILRILLSDNVKARQLQPDGAYTRVRPGDGELPVRSQVIFQTLARGSARDSGELALQFIPPVESKEPSEESRTPPSRKRERKRRVRIGSQRDTANEPDSATG